MGGALAGVLTRADPDDVRVFRIDDDAAERERGLLVEEGVKVMPRLVVFQSPPNAVATYHTLGFPGSISTS
jgi:hypothetical protein